MADNMIRLIANIIFMFFFVSLNFKIFRIPIIRNVMQILIIAGILGITNFYYKFILNDANTMFIQTVVYVIALMIVRGLPVLYAFIVVITGSVAITLIEMPIPLLAIQAKLTTQDLMMQNPLHFSAIHLSISLLCLLIIYVLEEFNLGFSFIERKFYGKHTLKPRNIFWAVLLFIILLLMQFLSVEWQKAANFYLHGYGFLITVVGLVSCIIYTKRQNEKIVEERYGQ